MTVEVGDRVRYRDGVTGTVEEVVGATLVRVKRDHFGDARYWPAGSCVKIDFADDVAWWKRHAIDTSAKVATLRGWLCHINEDAESLEEVRAWCRRALDKEPCPE